MKKIFFFLVVASFSGEALAQNGDIKPGTLKQLIEENFEEPVIEEKKSQQFKPTLINRLSYDLRQTDQLQASANQSSKSEGTSKGRLFSTLQFYNNFSLNSLVKIQQVNQASKDGDNISGTTNSRIFKNNGAFFEELNLVYNSKKYAVVAGKFDLDFGSAWRWNRGIWANTIAQNYQQTEKLGLSTIYRRGDSKKTGLYQFGFAAFTNDRKNLDNSIFVTRDSSSGTAPGDVRSPKSYLASLDINFDFAENEKLSYHFSYLNLAVNQRASLVAPAKIADQKGFAASMNYKYPISENFSLDNLLEYVALKNVGGNSDNSVNYFTGNTIMRFYQNWNITLSYADQHYSQVQAYGYNKNLSEISFGYEFNKNNFFDKLLFQIGYKNQRDNYKTSLETKNVLGALVRYQKTF
jgi:hypothetical protein